MIPVSYTYTHPPIYSYINIIHVLVYRSTSTYFSVIHIIIISLFFDIYEYFSIDRSPKVSYFKYS